MLEIQHPCFNDFPDQCVACPEYRETRIQQAPELTLLTGMTYLPHMAKIVKECKRYHKRKVEYQI